MDEIPYDKSLHSGRYFSSHENSDSSTKRNFPERKTKFNNYNKMHQKSPEDKLKSFAIRKEQTKKKLEKKRRIIIRNLSFKIDEKELTKILSKYGTITDVKIPTKPDGKKKGFAFAQFENFYDAVQAVKNLNYKEIHGRPIAIDYALAKDKYEGLKSSKLDNEVEEKPHTDTSVQIDSTSEEDELSDNDDGEKSLASEPESEKEETKMSVSSSDDKRVKKFMKEFEFEDKSDEEIEKDDVDNDQESSDEDEDEDSGKDDNDKNNEQSSKLQIESSKTKKTSSNDVQEGKTVFIRNIPFNADQDSFKDAIEEFGPVTYCLLCMDPLTELPRGTAFVKFENKEDAEKLIDKASNEQGNGVFFEHRKLYCSLALSREEIKQKVNSEPKEKKDKRNLRLLREGLIMANSEEAKGVSQTDLAKRAKLEAMKKQKLKNLNFFVSDTRLSIHNLPPDYTDQKLRQLFKEAITGKAIITEARIIKDMKKIGVEGEAKSKGFGFVAFNKHEHSLEALHKLNNNPSIFSDNKRPIVEFSIENHLALLTKERRRERNKNRFLKKKEIQNEETANVSQFQEQRNTNIPKRKNMKRKRKDRDNSSKKQEATDLLKESKKAKRNNPVNNVSEEHFQDSGSKKKTKNKRGRKKKQNMKSSSNKSLTSLVNQYKDKLLTKYNS